MSNLPHSDPNEDRVGKNECDVRGSIHVRGEIETRIPAEVVKKRDADEKKKEARDSKRFRVEWIGLIVLSLYTLITGLQAWNTQRQLVYTRRQLIYSQRPWVGLGDSAVLLKNVGDPVETHVSWKNFGNSPAFDLCWHTGLYRIDVSDLKSFDLQKSIDGLPLTGGCHYTVFTGQSMEKDRGYPSDPLQKGEREGLLSGTRAFIFGGRATYRDEFGNAHMTTFCRRLDLGYGDLPDRMFGCANFKETAN
jgi:hypothetical protein